MASRMAAKSATAGTPVKSCIKTRAGRKDISLSEVRVSSQVAQAVISSALTLRPSSKRKRFSSKIFKENGRREISPNCSAANAQAVIIVGLAIDLKCASGFQAVAAGRCHVKAPKVYVMNGNDLTCRDITRAGQSKGKSRLVAGGV